MSDIYDDQDREWYIKRIEELEEKLEAKTILLFDRENHIKELEEALETIKKNSIDGCMVNHKYSINCHEHNIQIAQKALDKK